MRHRLLDAGLSPQRPGAPRWYRALRWLEQNYAYPKTWDRATAIIEIAKGIRCTQPQALSAYGLIQQRGLIERSDADVCV